MFLKLLFQRVKNDGETNKFAGIIILEVLYP